MRILVCPRATIEAPIGIVLELLELQNWGKWIDGTVEKVSPQGQMVVGQEAVLHAKAFMINWKVRVKVVNIDKSKQRIRYDVFDPLGFKNEEDLEYVSLAEDRCEVHYNCNFIFQDGIGGFVVRTILGRKLVEVPEESIRRLKAEAEKEYGEKMAKK